MSMQWFNKSISPGPRFRVSAFLELRNRTQNCCKKKIKIEKRKKKKRFRHKNLQPALKMNFGFKAK